ncbi:MAG: SMP-30/gluconolactonase/LRE family protein [Planctomycetaceae bacterium]|nr:SMP-30/gluconolactonase/LRE family protein [Planctomycetaceae bacterium]
MKTSAAAPSLWVSLLLAGAVSTLDAAEPTAVPAPSASPVLSAEARLELLFTREGDDQAGLTEGPAAAPDGSIYFSDIRRGTTPGVILRFDPQTKKTTVFAENSHKSNGLIFDEDGVLLACEGADEGGRALSAWNVKTGRRTVLAEGYQGKRFNAPNDLCLDAAGRIYMTDPRYLGAEPRELKYRAVYRVDRSSRKPEVVEITHEVSKPNGIALSPDGRTLYVADHDNGSDGIEPEETPPTPGPMKIYAFPLDEHGLVNGPRRTLVDFGKEAGCDGMTVDERGNLYLTARSPQRPGVLVISPTGVEVAFIPTGPLGQKTDEEHPPVGLPSNVEFGRGSERNTLYITVDTSLYRIPLNTGRGE